MTLRPSFKHSAQAESIRAMTMILWCIEPTEKLRTHGYYMYHTGAHSRPLH